MLNPSNLGNDEYMIWGHNNGDLEASETTDVPGIVKARLDRVWRVSEVNESGITVDVGGVDIRWDLTALGAVTASDLRLLIDTDNDGVFLDETAISGATSLGGGIFEFSTVSGVTNNLRFTLGTINTGQTPLPVELVYFDASISDNKTVNLIWQTASEVNNNFFTIERSRNSIEWEIISVVKGAGNTGNKT